MQKVGVLGFGEVGKSIYEVIKDTSCVFVRTLQSLPEEVSPFEETDTLDVLHVCIPYSDTFVDTVVKTAREKHAGLTIIESTVPVGTTRKIAKQGVPAVHSPVRGNHPNLATSIKTFIKYVGGINKEDTQAVKAYYEQFGITVVAFNSAEETELAKLLCTTYYGWNIIFCKQVKAISDAFGVEFDNVYTKWNRTYNEGYEAMNRNEVRRPILKPIPGPTGGHCVTNNNHLLFDLLDEKGLTDIPEFFLDHDK